MDYLKAWNRLQKTQWILLSFCLLSLAQLASAEEKRIVWGTPISPFVKKVLVCLHEKGLPYQNEAIFPEKMLLARKLPVPPSFKEASPFGKIPALQDGALSISDSAVIAAYLEKKYPEQRLYPEDPATFAQALFMEKFGDLYLADAIHPIFFERCIKPSELNQNSNEGVVQKALEELRPFLDYLEKRLQGFDFAAGAHFSIADIAIAVQLVCLDEAQVAIDGDADGARWPHVVAWKARVLSRPAFATALTLMKQPVGKTMVGKTMDTTELPEPPFLFKIISLDDWDKSKASQDVVLSAADSDFIHLSTEEQLPAILRKYWADRPHVVLKLDTRQLQGDLKLEANPGGSTRYYHLYQGNIPVDAVIEYKPS
ncbi:MAG: glutathione S-transferase [Chlamydiales bacterium]|jgi:glutathione S-transferase|nr:glutathione S-transferase [Chlamydiales bacterium]